MRTPIVLPGRPAVSASGNVAPLLLVGGLVLGLLGGMAAVSEYLAGDWQRVEDCSESYWTCHATVGGMPRTGGSTLIGNERLARACREYEAWERSVRRASFDCSMSRQIVSGSCRTMDVECELPDQLY